MAAYAPPIDETFKQLFERAQMLEKHENQFSASAACRNESQTKKRQTAPTVPSSRSAVTQRLNKAPEADPACAPGPEKGLCHDCEQPGHWTRHCLQ